MCVAPRHRVPKDRVTILEIGDEKLKLKEMRKVTSEMISGNDMSHLFPNVVKNVACKSVEVTASLRLRWHPRAL